MNALVYWNLQAVEVKVQAIAEAKCLLYFRAEFLPIFINYLWKSYDYGYPVLMVTNWVHFM